MKHIMKCVCGKYTLQQSCPECNEKTIQPKPPKYSPEDHYGSYRRKVKKQGLEESGLL